jgi:predicted NodU family carbamoyl transferase
MGTVKRVPEAELLRRTAAAIAEGRLVGWFQGRMEWGPRALGNRSILRAEAGHMKQNLNAKIKRRARLRPYARVHRGGWRRSVSGARDFREMLRWVSGGQ